MRKVFLVIMLAIFASLILSLNKNKDIYFGGCSGRSTQLDAFSPYVDEYLRINIKPLSEKPYITGKIVTVNKSINKIDLLFLKLPEKIRAVTPDEVGTIVWLEYGEFDAGSFSNGAKAFQKYCKVTLIDKSRAGAFESVDFNGPPPPKTTGSGGSWHGDKPSSTEILKYLRSLPQR